MNYRDVQVTCKKCGKKVNSSEFVLDHVYKMMVCQTCVKERKTKEKTTKAHEEKQQSSNQPTVTEVKAPPKPGWDNEDDYIERAYKAKQQIPAAQVTRVDDTKVKYTCPKCKYATTYNTITKSPKTCSYCNRPIEGIKN